ncbi:hypothetical protein BKA80DRAFT_286828 [Phyllosticta citrichinensis]
MPFFPQWAVVNPIFQSSEWLILPVAALLEINQADQVPCPVGWRKDWNWSVCAVSAHGSFRRAFPSRHSVAHSTPQTRFRVLRPCRILKHEIVEPLVDSARELTRHAEEKKETVPQGRPIGRGATA